MSFRRQQRAFGPRNRGVWLLLVIMLGVLALSCCAGLLASIAQRSNEPAPSASQSGVSKPTDAAPTGAPADGVIPDVVCRDLQAAQDALQAAGFYVLASADGTGQGRRQLIDRNWVVVEQSATPGSRPVPSTRVLLTVVKIGEPTDRCV